jgi:hypothetical protein
VPTHYRNGEKFKEEIIMTKTKLNCGGNMLVIDKNGYANFYYNDGSYLKNEETFDDLMIKE